MFSFRLALALAVLILALSATCVLAVDPTPAASGVPSLIDPLDPRAGAGANRVGAPLLALIAVIVIGAATAALTGLYVRLTRAP